MKKKPNIDVPPRNDLFELTKLREVWGEDFLVEQNEDDDVDADVPEVPADEPVKTQKRAKTFLLCAVVLIFTCN